MSKLNNFSWDDNPNLQGKFGEEFEEQIADNLDKNQEGDDNHDFSFKEEGKEKDSKADDTKEAGSDDDKDGAEEDENHEFQFGDEDGEGSGDDDEDEEGEEEDGKDATKSKEKKKPETGLNKSEKINSRGVVSFLKDKGFLDLKDDVKLEDLTDDELDDQLEDFIDSSNESYLESQIAELPPVAKNLLKIAAKGGDVNKYLQSVADTSSKGLKKDLDLGEEKNQEKVMRVLLAQEGKDSDEIEDEIEFLKSKNRLEGTSKKRFDKWSEAETKKESDFLAQETSRKSQAKEQTRKYRGELSTHLSKAKEVSSFNITSVDKRDLPNYIANPAYETDNGNSISEFQKDLYEAMKDNDKIVVLAKILKSNFDFSKLVEKGANKTLKDVKDTIQNQKPNNTTKRERSSKRLIDML